MGTNENENVKNVNEKIIKNNKDKSDQTCINTGGSPNDSKFDIQATQRIVILDELKKDTEKSIKNLLENQQGTTAPQKEIVKEEKIIPISEHQNKEVINIPKSGSENSVEPGAKIENLSKVIVSQNDAPQNPKQIINDQNEQIENNKENENTQVDNNSPEDVKNKEKQHAQDKKDYRLEKMLFDRINKMQGKIKESLELIKKFERINAKEENLPNIVTTLHDKLTHEVIKQFRTVGIEFNMKSYLVQAIVSDLLSKFEEGITEFKDCSENLNFVREVQEDFESRVDLAPTSKVKNFFARIRGMFKPERKQERIQQLERERQEKKLQEANIHLIKYKFINSELEKYTIRKNIVNSLTREILYGQGSGLTLNINEFIDEKIILEMKKLGLEGVIPQLKNNLYEEYKLKDEGISQEDFEKLSVGDVRKNIKFKIVEAAYSKINTVISNNAQVESENERMAI